MIKIVYEKFKLDSRRNTKCGMEKVKGKFDGRGSWRQFVIICVG